MINEKALAYACKSAGRSLHHYRQMAEDLPLKASITAHARTLVELDALRLEVSDAIAEYFDGGIPEDALGFFHRFIIAKRDPLVEAVDELWTQDSGKAKYMADQLRAYLTARGLKIVEVGHD